MKNIFISFLIIIINIISFKCDNSNQKIEILKLNDPIYDKLTNDDSLNYYQLRISEKVEKDNILIFTVKQSFKDIKINDELFSDPNIYISKSYPYPSNKEEADWYSDQYGNDILSIPNHALGKDEMFYIGLHCPKKCNYELKAYLSNEIELELGRIYYIKIPKKSTQSYFIKINQDIKYEELNVIANCPTLKSYKIFMSRDSPSSQNSFKVNPSWGGGYSINIDKKNDNFCKNCTYHILLETQNDDVQIQLNIYGKNHLTNIKMSKPIFDAVKKDSNRCYRFPVSEEDINNKEQIIIQTTLYSGLIYLYITGFNKEQEKDIYDIRRELYSYRIETNQIILLKKQDIERFLLKSNNRYYNDNEQKYIYFCIYGQLMSSYVVNAFSLSKTELNQDYNFISPSSEMTGYLFQNHVTKYELLDYNINSNTNITLNINKLQGEAKFYVLFSDDYINISKENFEYHIMSKEVLIPKIISSQLSTVVISRNNNKCYRKKDDDKNSKCRIYVLTICEKGDNDNICSYRLNTIYEDIPILLSPKRTYFNFIPKGKQDIYEILISEPEVNSLVVVLNSASGDAELTLKKKKDINEIGISKNTEILGISKKDDYLPDVIRITPKTLASNNLIGRYLVYVTAKTFSSYNLYFYTTLNEIKDKNITMNDVTASLKEGQMIKDYFPHDIDYKIYSYTPQLKKDIKIILTRINVKFNFFVFKDFNKIIYKKYLENIYIEKIEGYDWASDVNNEITISKDDPKFNLNETLYILVTKNEMDEMKNIEEDFYSIEDNVIMEYYIGLTQEGIPFVLNEGIEHSETLSEKYKAENYFYSHYNLSESFILDIMILNGDIDIYIDVKEITENDIKSIQNNEYNFITTKTLKYQLGIDNYYNFELSKEYFEQYYNNKNNNYNNNYMEDSCQIFIYITQGQMSKKHKKDSQYIITPKSSKNKGKMILSGNVYQGELNPEEKVFFYIEEIKSLKSCTIYVNFYSPGGEVYVRIPENPEIGKDIIYPNSTYYDYKGKMNMMGKEIKIPEKVFDRTKTKSLKVQIFITIEASNMVRTMNFKKNTLKYSIYFSSESKRINQNIPYTFYIQQGEYHYYMFYFDSSTENIYISLSNMNGDADLYLNYGDEEYPTPEDSNWASLTSGQEYISINKDDKFFKEKDIKDISGYYTLLVTGVTNTTYTLFISSFKDKVFPLTDNTPVNCRCEHKKEKCYFRYNKIFKDSTDKNINYNEIIFTSEYKYGNGKMYAKIMKERELNYEFRNKNYISFFPDEKNYQFSNSEKGKRNYMKVIVDKDNYSKDSLILMTLICDEKSDAEITTASLSFNPTDLMLVSERENTFYIKYNPSYNNYTNNYLFYSFKGENIFYQIHAYLGKAKIKIFSKDEKSRFSDKNAQIHISEFIINSENKNNNENDYLNYISKTMTNNKFICFEVTPMSDFGFFIQIMYDRTWVKIPIGKEKKIFIKNERALAYFNIYKVYSSIDINFNMENCLSKQLKIYLKFQVYEKKEEFNDIEISLNDTEIDEFSLNYESPNRYNYDYKAKIKNMMCTANINIPDVPEYEELFLGKKVIRALIGFYIYQDDDIISTPMEDDEDEDDYYDEINYYKKKKKKKYKKKSKKIESKENIVNIMVSPSINNIKRIDLSPYKIYYSKTSLLEYDYQTEEIKIFNMDKIHKNDSNIIINVYSCSGQYDFKVSSKIVSYDDNENDIYYDVKKDVLNRKIIYTIPNLNQNHIYVSIKPQISNKCKDANRYINLYGDENIRSNCSDELSYLIYYYSGSHINIIDSELLNDLRYRRDNKIIWIKIPFLKDYEYNIFWTKNSEMFYKMDCLCYLNELASDIKKGRIDEVKYLENIQLNEKNEFPIEEKNKRENVFVMVVARNIKTNELSNFNPLIVHKVKGFNGFLVFIYFFVIFGLYLFIVRLQSKNKLNIGKKDDDIPEIEMKTQSHKRYGYSSLSKADF